MHSELIQTPFGRMVTATKDYMQSSTMSPAIFDAVYIPSRGQRIPLEKTLNVLRPYCKEYVFLFTDFIPDWFEKIALIFLLHGSNTVRAVKVADSEYSSSYIGKTENQNISVQWRIDFDIPLKRSYALYDARKKGYRYIGMIDDDILLENEPLQNAIFALEQGNCVVGFHVDWYPDKCTLDHVKRELTSVQEPISMTGSTLFLDLDETHGDFPLVYNEDLFFFLQQPDLDRVVSGGIIHQETYESWKTGERVMHEQFGELVYTAILQRMTKEGKHGEKNRVMYGEMTKTELSNKPSKHINWNDELSKAMKRVENVIAFDSEGVYTNILEKALKATRNITTESIKDFVDVIPFSDIIKSFV